MPDEFNCVDCGRHIVAFPRDVMKMKMCAACLCVPGWWTMPAVAKLIDPEHDRTVEDDA